MVVVVVVKGLFGGATADPQAGAAVSAVRLEVLLPVLRRRPLRALHVEPRVNFKCNPR